MTRFFLSTPIYYVNAKPHLGHAYTSIVADCLTRFQRAMGKDTFLLTGVDEHGDKIVRAAEKNNATPQEYVDRISGVFRDLLPRMNVEHSRFIRTTSPEHTRCVQEFLQLVYDKGDIYFGEYGGHYCYGCERFYTEKELENGLCPQHKEKPTFLQEKNYFFRMAKHQPWLIEHIKANRDFIRPERYRNEVLSLLESGALEDLCISRPKSRLSWGVELPFDRDYVCYVWFDALLNYISALNWPDGEAFRAFWPKAEHLVAKDILKPHAVFWPTMLRAAGIEPYRRLNVHGYWLVQDTKMSKSLGNVVDPLDLAERHGLDAFRYFLLREMHFGSDANFSEDALIARLNADLANDLGNLFSRALSMVKKYNDSRVPSPVEYAEDDLEIRDLALTAVGNFQRFFGRVEFSKALESLWELVRGLNRYIDKSAPWALHKSGDTARLGTVLYVTLEGMRKVAVHLWPAMPQAAAAMLDQLGQPGWAGATPKLDLARELDSWGELTPGTVLAEGSNLFPRAEVAAKTAPDPSASKPAKADKAAAKAAAKAADNAAAKTAAPALAPGHIQPLAPAVEFPDFQKIDLRVGTVQSALRHPDADRLYVLSVDLGEDAPRTIVAGLAEHWPMEALVGRQVVVVANLKPRPLRGVMSQGMVLAVRREGGLELLGPSGAVADGTKVS